MNIGKGEDWGTSEPLPDDAVEVPDDRTAAEAVAAARRENRPVPPLRLTGGDLARTLGGRRDGSGAPTEPGICLPVDLGAVLLDGRMHWFLAHLVARRSWWRGRIVVVANAAFIGDWNVAPRAHPGDGRLDVLDGDLPLRDRLAARRRLPTGTHVPHPAINQRRTAATQFEFSRPTPIELDGRRIGRATTLSVRVEPAAVRVWV